MKKFIVFIILAISGLSLSTIFSAKEVVIIYTGNINGSLKDCGCSGEQMGGLARIKTLVDDIRSKQKNTYLIDTGDLFTSYYNPEKSLFLSTVIKDLDYDFILKSDNAYASGITKFIDLNAIHKNNPLFDYILPKKAFDYVPDSLKPATLNQEKNDNTPFMIYHGSKQDYLNAYPNQKAKFVFLSHTQDLIDEYDETSQTYFFQPGMDTEYVGVLYLKERNGAFSFDKHVQVRLDSTVAENTDVKNRVENFFTHYEYSGTLPNLQTYFYFGADYCKSCHLDIFENWKESNHAHAYETLKQENRAFDPDCISCHTTGYRQGGFKSILKTPQFQNVQCESCHINMPSEHSRVSDRVGIKKVDNQTCLTCHTEKNSPNFNLEAYMLKIKHWKSN